MTEPLKKYEVYPGDTYIKDKKRAAKVRYAWLAIGIFAMLLSALIDLYNISDLIMKINDASPDKDAFQYYISYPVAFSITAIFLILGVYVGNNLRLYISKRREFNSFAVAICIVLIIGFIIIVTAFRTFYAFDSEGTGISDFLLGILYTSSMIIGSAISILFGYFQKDSVTEEIAMEAEKRFHDDKSVYEKSKQFYTESHLDNIKWNIKYKKIKNKIAKSKINLQKYRASLGTIQQDPATAQDTLRYIDNINDAIFDDDNNNDDDDTSNIDDLA